MKVIPKKNQILGRIVDVVRTESGLALPTAQNNATVFAIVDAVGPDVTEYAVGNIVLPAKMNHIYVRGGFHRVIFSDTEILGVVEVSRNQLSIGGEEVVATNGSREATAP